MAEEAATPEVEEDVFSPEIEQAASPTEPEAKPAETPPETEEAKSERERDEKGRFVKAPEVTRYQHSPALARLAYQAGIDQETFELSPPEDLRELIRYSQAQKPEPKAEPEEDEFENFVPEIAKVLKGLKGEIKSVREENQQLKQAHQQHASRQATENWDKLFASAPEHLAGKGEMAGLKPNSEEANWRIKIVKLAGGDLNKAKEIIGMLNVAPSYPGTVPEAVQKEAKRWQDNGLLRPTNRETKEPNGVKKAVKSVEKLLAARRGSENGSTEDDDNGLPE